MCDVISTATVKTRKPHRCWGCTKLYPVGTKMDRIVSKDAGEIGTAYWCDECNKTLQTDEFWRGEDCFMYGALGDGT